jgi:hypothetical protein
MRPRITIVIAALALGGAMVGTSAFAQNAPLGRAANDGGIIAEPTGTAQYNGAGAVAPGNETGASTCAARFHSFDPASGTYLGRDGQRRPCR